MSPGRYFIKAFILLIYLSIFYTPLFAQKQHTHGVFWGRLVLADKINNKLKWELYLQKRTQSAGTDNIFKAPHFISIWPWLNYKLTSNTKISLSPIAYFDSHVFYDNIDDIKAEGIKEYRISMRIENEQKFLRFNYSNRYSLEYRMRDLMYNGEYKPNWRARYQFRLEKPFLNILSKNKPVSVFVADEIFIQFGSAVKSNPNIFDQNRISLGMGYEVIKNIKLSASYLNIIQQRISGKDIDNAHALWIVLSFENLISQFKKHKNS